MPTRNGLVTPTEIKDEFLKDHGVEGFVHPGTGLLLPYSEEAEQIIAEELERADDPVQIARVVRSFNDTRTERRRKR